VLQKQHLLANRPGLNDTALLGIMALLGVVQIAGMLARLAGIC